MESYITMQQPPPCGRGCCCTTMVCGGGCTTINDVRTLPRLASPRPAPQTHAVDEWRNVHMGKRRIAAAAGPSFAAAACSATASASWASAQAHSP